MAKHKKPTPAAKKPVRKATKPAPKKEREKEKVVAAPAPAAKKSVNVAPVAPPPAAPVAAEPKKKSAVSNSEKQTDKASARDLLRSRILGGKKSAKPIAFSLDEVREIAKTAAAKSPATSEEPKVAKTPAKATKTVDVTKTAKPAQPHHIKAASLADILGFNPRKPQASPVDDSENVPEKFRKFYKLLIDLRSSLTEGLSLHTEETLKRSSKDDSGDLSSYGQHMADAGTDTFDRDFALSLVSSEQEALTEIEAAIKRIHDGTYGICEVTGKPIAKERLLAVPFTRYSAEAQKEIEKNRMRTRTSAGLFGELGEDGAKIADDEGGED